MCFTLGIQILKHVRHVLAAMALMRVYFEILLSNCRPVARLNVCYGPYRYPEARKKIF